MFSGMMRGLVPMIGFNLLVGARSTGIDQAAHIGGLLAGGACGLLLSHPLATNFAFQRLWRNAVLAVLGTVLIVAAIRNLPSPHNAAGYFGEVTRFAEAEAAIETIYKSAQERLRAGEITATDFGKIIRRDILPPWIIARDRLAAEKPKNLGQQQNLERLTQYATLRAEAWTMQADAIEQNDMQAFGAALLKHEEADRIGLGK